MDRYLKKHTSMSLISMWQLLIQPLFCFVPFVFPSSTVRALNKNFSIAFLFPVFITLLFFQHNRTVYDIVAGTIVVQRRGGR